MLTALMVTQAQIAKKLGVSRQPVTFALAGYGKKQGIAVALGNDPKYQQINISPLPGDKENTGGSLENLLSKAGPVPTATNGKMMAVCLAVFIAFFAVRPGVCMRLALSELTPNRIRSVGMGVALLVNQGASTGVAAFFLRETNGRALEEIGKRLVGEKSRS